MGCGLCYGGSQGDALLPAAGCMEFQNDILVVKLGQVIDTEMNFYEIPD